MQYLNTIVLLISACLSTGAAGEQLLNAVDMQMEG